MSIVIDPREPHKQDALDYFKKKGLKAEISLINLPVGDYIVNNYSVFELKKDIDFASSLFDGRLLRQVQGMQQFARRFILI